MAKRYMIPSEVHLLVPRRQDSVLNPSLKYCSIYQDQIKARIRFFLLSLLIEVLTHYNIPRLSLPLKNAKWKEKKLFPLRFHLGVEIPVLWRASKVVDDLTRMGFPNGFKTLNGETVKRDLAKEIILVRGEASYTWSITLGESLSSVPSLCFVRLHSYICFCYAAKPLASCYRSTKLEAQRASQTNVSKGGVGNGEAIENAGVIVVVEAIVGVAEATSGDVNVAVEEVGHNQQWVVKKHGAIEGHEVDPSVEASNSGEEKPVDHDVQVLTLFSKDEAKHSTVMDGGCEERVPKSPRRHLKKRLRSEKDTSGGQRLNEVSFLCLHHMYFFFLIGFDHTMIYRGHNL